MHYNTTAAVGTIYPDGLRCTIIHQQFVQHALGRPGLQHESVCKQYVPTVNKIQKHYRSNCIAGSTSSSSNRIVTSRRCRYNVVHQQDSTAAIACSIVEKVECGM